MSILLSIKLQKSEKMSPDDHDKIKSPHLRKVQNTAKCDKKKMQKNLSESIFDYSKRYESRASTYGD